VAGLLEGGARVSALVRRPPTARLPAAARVTAGDLERPHTVAGAAADADAAFLLWPSFSAAGASAVITELARQVSHVVYLSAARLQHDDDGVMAGVWADVERLIEASGVGWTFVRAGGFAANTLDWSAQVRAGDTVRIPYPDAARSLVHERDIADVAVHGLLDPALAGRALAVTGPEVLTQRAQVHAIGAAIARELRVQAQPPEDARRQYAAAMGPSTPTARSRIGRPWSTPPSAPPRTFGG
jgi:uncharacterized protein YbjT (DUF2867 family)